MRNVKGARRSPFYVLTEEDITELLKDIRAIGADENIFLL